MGRSKIDYFGETLIDLTGDSVTPDKLWAGTTAHNAAGDPIVGTMTATVIAGYLDQDNILTLSGVDAELVDDILVLSGAPMTLDGETLIIGG